MSVDSPTPAIVCVCVHTCSEHSEHTSTRALKLPVNYRVSLTRHYNRINFYLRNDLMCTEREQTAGVRFEWRKITSVREVPSSEFPVEGPKTTKWLRITQTFSRHMQLLSMQMNDFIWNYLYSVRFVCFEYGWNAWLFFIIGAVFGTSICTMCNILAAWERASVWLGKLQISHELRQPNEY